MINNEKLNIYVPKRIGELLHNDALMFEILKINKRDVNMNDFLGRLIMGYYNLYALECKDYHDRIYAQLVCHDVNAKDAHDIANNILNNVILPYVPPRKGKKPVRLSLKPTRETKGLIQNVENELGPSDTISQYFCKMFMSYCEKPISERERIIFRNSYVKIKEACDHNSTISFSTIWNTKKRYKVIPYEILVGQEEMFNYLLCAEIDMQTGKQEAKAFRLNRISGIQYSSSSDQMTEEAKHYLGKMKEYGPQYKINDDEETCVRLTDLGRINYGRIYYGRPTPDDVKDKEDGHYYYFKGSKDQLFFYFRRFGSDAEIISPESLREKMKNFHLNAYENYK